ncbi:MULTISPECIES: hypothetical protein [Bacillales]|uniref:hypothetical protein n=1 Tax=Bacillales TaxID=1385 RepID=UPI0003481FBC|nr:MULTISPECIES: hypothetical protein [Bacillales]KMZ43993.1 hypothetical protein AC624_24505 [Bacillus sp. FJAT-27238]
MDYRGLIKKLTDNYVKGPASTIGKLFRVLTPELEELKQTIEKIALYRDIDAADGATLDRIGKNLKQPRAHLGDGAYRTLLKTKIKRNTSRGDINTIIEVFAAVMDIPHEKVYVREVFPAGLYIRVPLTPLQDALFDSATIIGEFVQGTLAGGVGLEVPFEGTFEFASALSPEMDDQKGFSDLEQEIGGYFGGVYKSDR